jgi:hypothetical protein
MWLLKLLVLELNHVRPLFTILSSYLGKSIQSWTMIEVNICLYGCTLGIKVLKCLEGQYNKAFLMTMDNGVEVLAKIPNPNAGSAFYTTASEVATRSFVSTFVALKSIQKRLIPIL